VAGALVGELLHNGEASLLFQALVKDKKVALSVNGGANWPLGNPFEYNGPTLMTSFIVYPSNVTQNQLLDDYDRVIARVKTDGPTAGEMERIKTKMKSDWYSQLEIPISRASALSHAALFDGTADAINRIPAEIDAVTPAEVKAFAAQYLVPANRTIIDRVPEANANKGGQQ
jgi:predicted Zn-dependent peptidase